MRIKFILGIIVLLLIPIASAIIIEDGIILQNNNANYTVSGNISFSELNLSTNLTIDNTTFYYSAGYWELWQPTVYTRSILNSNPIAASINISTDNATGSFETNTDYQPILTNDTWTFQGLADNHIYYSNAFQLNSSNESIYLYFTANINFTLLDEYTTDLFNVSRADSIRMTVFCEEDLAHEYFFTNSSENFAINCSHIDFVKFDVTYNVTEQYFRTRLIYTDQYNYTIYLIDLTQNTAVESIINLNDLTGQYIDGYVRVKKDLYDIGEVISQYYDIENKVTLYLIKDNVYTLDIIDNDGNVRSWGNFIPVSADSQTVTLPEVNFKPAHSTIEDCLTWSYNYTGTKLLVTYLDNCSNTVNGTLNLYNYTDKNSDPVLIYSTTQTADQFTITFTDLNINESYISDFIVYHSNFTSGLFLVDQRFWSEFSKLNVNNDGFSEEDWQTIKKFSALFIIFGTVLIFNYRHIHEGLIVVAFMSWFFILEQWLTTGDTTKDYLILGVITTMVILDNLALYVGNMRSRR